MRVLIVAQLAGPCGASWERRQVSVVCEGGNRSARPPDMLLIVRGTDSLFCNRRVDIHDSEVISEKEAL